MKAGWPAPKPMPSPTSQRLGVPTPVGSLDGLWSRPVEECFGRLGSGIRGVSSREAARRLADIGRNVAVEPTRRRLLSRIGKRLIEPLIAILIVAALISGATGDWGSLVIILTILAISIALDVTQEHRAEAATATRKASRSKTSFPATSCYCGLAISCPLTGLSLRARPHTRTRRF